MTKINSSEVLKNKPDYNIMLVMDKRAGVWVDEIPTSTSMSASFAKNAVGAQKDLIRPIYQGAREIEFNCNLAILANNAPSFNEEAEGLSSKLVVIKTENEFEKKHDCPYNEAWLTERAAGLLHILYDVWVFWIKNGGKMHISKIISKHTKDYWKDIDVFNQWLSENIKKSDCETQYLSLDVISSVFGNSECWKKIKYKDKRLIKNYVLQKLKSFVIL